MAGIDYVSKVDSSFDNVRELSSLLRREAIAQASGKLPLGAMLDGVAVMEVLESHIKLSVRWIQAHGFRVVAPIGVFVPVWDVVSQLAPVELPGTARTVRAVLGAIDENEATRITGPDGVVYRRLGISEEDFIDQAHLINGIDRVSTASNEFVYGSKDLMTATVKRENDHVSVHSNAPLTRLQAQLAAALDLRSELTLPEHHPDHNVHVVVM